MLGLRATGTRLLGWLGRLVEVAAGFGVLVSVRLLIDLRSAQQTEAAGTFVVGFLFLWVGSLGTLALFTGGRAVRWGLRRDDGALLDRVRGQSRRFGLEAGVAIVFVASTVPVGYVGGGGFPSITAASVWLATVVVVHHLGAVFLAGRRAISS